MVAVGTKCLGRSVVAVKHCHIHTPQSPPKIYHYQPLSHHANDDSPAMSNAWTATLRPPYAALRFPSTSQPWHLAARIATGRAFSARALSNPKPSPLNPPRPSTRIPHGPYLPRTYDTVPPHFRFFKTSATTQHSQPARKPPPKQPPKRPSSPKPPPSQTDTQTQTETHPQTQPTPNELPLPSGPLSPSQIHAIFGPSIPTKTGNEVLRTLHRRRVSGSLAERGISDLAGRAPQLTRERVLDGLAWLREEFPVDEEGAAARWAEGETERVGREIGASAAGEGELGLQGTEYGRARHGQSVMDAVRRENKANWEVEKRRREVEEKKMMVEERRKSGRRAVAAREGAGAPKRFLGVELSM